MINEKTEERRKLLINAINSSTTGNKGVSQTQTMIISSSKKRQIVSQMYFNRSNNRIAKWDVLPPILQPTNTGPMLIFLKELPERMECIIEDNEENEKNKEESKKKPEIIIIDPLENELMQEINKPLEEIKEENKFPEEMLFLKNFEKQSTIMPIERYKVIMRKRNGTFKKIIEDDFLGNYKAECKFIKNSGN